jgi:hypothetical protein
MTRRVAVIGAGAAGYKNSVFSTSDNIVKFMQIS